MFDEDIILILSWSAFFNTKNIQNFQFIQGACFSMLVCIPFVWAVAETPLSSNKGVIAPEVIII